MANKQKEKNPRLGQVGGQAIIEGIMMRSGEDIAISVRATDGTIRSKKKTFVSIKKKRKILGLPLIRGMVSFVESLLLSFSTINDGVDMLGIEEEETKFEKSKRKPLKISTTPTKLSAKHYILSVCISFMIVCLITVLLQAIRHSRRGKCPF